MNDNFILKMIELFNRFDGGIPLNILIPVKYHRFEKRGFETHAI